MRILTNTRSITLIVFAVTFSGVFLSCCDSAQWKTSEADAERLSQSDLSGSIEKRILALKQLSAAESNAANRKNELDINSRLVRQLLKASRFKEAESYSEKAVVIAEHLYGPDDPRILPQVTQLYAVERAVPNKARTTELLFRMIALQEKMSGKDSVPVMWLLSSYARSVSPACGEALDLEKLRQLVRLRDKFSQPTEADALRDRLTYADCLSNTKSAEAYQSFEETLKMARSSCPKLVPLTLLRYAKPLDRKKLYAKSVPLLQEAFELQGPGKNFHPVLTPQIASEYGFALESLNRKTQASAVYGAVAQHYKNTGEATNPYCVQFSNLQKNLLQDL